MERITALIISSFFLFLTACAQPSDGSEKLRPVVGAESTSSYFSLISGKRLGLVVNQTSRIGNSHLVDSLIRAGMNVSRIFTLEHGFRGDADAGKALGDSMDPATGVRIVSLYGNKKKPAPSDLEGIDIMVFDIQDVGVRFYTYISSLHYIMQACAENKVPLVLLDRPNPNIHYVDGPVLTKEFKSFVGMHPVPVVYGMTIGEYGRMINGEGWLEDGKQCDLTVIPCQNYHRSSQYSLPVNPSPNLRSDNAIRHYPSLCFFEPTVVSVGRGTDFPFECYGYPGWSEIFTFSFTPMPQKGASEPKHSGESCYGVDLRTVDASREKLELHWLFEAYRRIDKTNVSFFTNERFFDLLAGTDQLRVFLKEGRSHTEFRDSYQESLSHFRQLRSQYLIYSN